ncbi:hypothetical protein D779_1217 [Imhoffiella purpurea]|uniref:Uncharacterized protein n=1 Tax=Imhoffiella purpurea TaxID=1249627 RepID=W9VYK7_9GAMM|nr:hypothetical protein D779_1217 [Imhoffiella purpurea]
MLDWRGLGQTRAWNQLMGKGGRRDIGVAAVRSSRTGRLGTPQRPDEA